MTSVYICALKKLLHACFWEFVVIFQFVPLLFLQAQAITAITDLKIETRPCQPVPYFGHNSSDYDYAEEELAFSPGHYSTRSKFKGQGSGSWHDMILDCCILEAVIFLIDGSKLQVTTYCIVFAVKIKGLSTSDISFPVCLALHRLALPLALLICII